MTNSRFSMSTHRLVLCVCLITIPLSRAEAQQPAPKPAPSIASHPEWPAVKNPSDVDSVEHLVASLYDVISGPSGKPRDWERFRSLFLPDGRLGKVVADSAATTSEAAQKGDVIFVSPERYIERNDSYMKTHSFFERSVTNRIERFGNLSSVWSTYESRHAKIRRCALRTRH